MTTMMTPDTAQDPAAVDHRRRLLHRSQYGNHDRGYRQPGKYNSVSAGSALSQSMRYADDWLYERDAAAGCGTVGHGGGGRKTRSTFFGREHFGTAAVVAIAAAAAVTANAVKPAAATQDPYDRVRKNRMAGVSAANVSGSGGGHLPDRKRNRSGGGGESSRTPSPDYYDDGTAGVSSQSRRSILECDVNPYDLLRRPSDDDDDDNDNDDCDDSPPRRMSLKDKFMSRIQDTVVFTKNRTSIGGFSSFSNGGSGKKTTADRNHGGVLIAGHTVSEQRLFPLLKDDTSVFPETALFPYVIFVDNVRPLFRQLTFSVYTQVRLFDGKNPAAAKNVAASSSVWYDDGSASDAVIPAADAVAAATQATTTAQAAVAVQSTVTTATATDQSPVRPPRRRCGRSAAFATSGSAKRSQSLTAGTTPAVKSILKKPASLTTDDLSPVRSRTTVFAPAVASALAASNVPTPNHDGSQKKTKKQVQFDIVTKAVGAEKPDSDSCPTNNIRTATDTDNAEQRLRNRQRQSPQTGMRSS